MPRTDGVCREHHDHKPPRDLVRVLDVFRVLLPSEHTAQPKKKRLISSGAHSQARYTLSFELRRQQSSGQKGITYRERRILSGVVLLIRKFLEAWVHDERAACCNPNQTEHEKKRPGLLCLVELLNDDCLTSL